MVDSATPMLKKTDAGWTASVGFTNLTTAPVTLQLPDARASCSYSFAQDSVQPSAAVAAAQQAKLTVSIASGCKAEADDFTFAIASNGAPSSFVIDPAPAEKQTPEWRHLWVFPGALGGFLLLGLITLGFWSAPPLPAEESADQQARDRDETTAVTGIRARLRYPLPYLGETWSFKDSWITNLTVVGALLTSVVGSADVVKAFLGDDADSAVALAIIGSAIAAGFVGAGAIVLVALQNREGDPTAGALMAAAATTSAGAFGQLYIGFWTGEDLKLGSAQALLLVALIAAAILLLLYVHKSFQTNLDLGANAPKDPDYDKKPYTETIFAAHLVAAALAARDDLPESKVEELHKRLVPPDPDYPRAVTGRRTSRGDDRTRRRPASLM